MLLIHTNDDWRQTHTYIHVYIYRTRLAIRSHWWHVSVVNIIPNIVAFDLLYNATTTCIFLYVGACLNNGGPVVYLSVTSCFTFSLAFLLVVSTKVTIWHCYCYGWCCCSCCCCIDIFTHIALCCRQICVSPT